MKRLIYLQSFFFLTFFSTSVFSQSVAINEILSSNISVNQDEDATYQDWVEIYNYGSTSVNLNGYGLSDDIALPLKWTFPNVTLGAGQYMLIWCSDKNRRVAGSPLHTNFKISAGGEGIYLSNAAGSSINSIPAVALTDNISDGRIPNGTGSFFYFNIPTPGAANGSVGYTEILPSPTFSQNGGFFTAGFNLTLSTTASGATIIYTLDGSEPVQSNLSGTTYSYKNSYKELVSHTSGPLLQNSFRSLTYSAPIAISNRTSQANKLAAMSSTHHNVPFYIPTTNIFKGTVVRARVVKAGALPSAVVTKTYFITPLGSSQFSLPVVSISLAENNLFDYTTGIFNAGKRFDDWRTANPTIDADPYNFEANFRNGGENPERRANINYFVGGSQILNQDIGFRVNGASSRAWQSKSFRLIADAEYGKSSFDYKFFSDKSLSNFNRLVLSNSGNDFFNTMYRTAFCHRLVDDLGMEINAQQPTVTFVNGEYWGILNLKERYDKYYFKNTHDIDSTELDLLSNEQEVVEGDSVFYDSIITFMNSNSLAVQSNFDNMSTKMDMENWRDYFISNIYFGNTDWPGTNTEFWRKRTASYLPNAPYGHDGRYRACIQDTDGGFGLSTDTDHDTLAFATEPNGPDYPNPPRSTIMLRSLLTNTAFKNGFINRFADLLNSYFSYNRVNELNLQMKSIYLPEIDRHIERWESVERDYWDVTCQDMSNFAQARPNFQRQHIRNKFGIANNINVTLNVSHTSRGYIKINTINILGSTPGIAANPYPWTGVYFSGIPVKYKAVALPGYVFSHWSGAYSGTNSEVTFSTTGNITLTANFIPDTTNNTSLPIYFWLMDDSIANNIPLTSLNSTFQPSTNGVIQYQSCLTGYPFTSTNANWRKASMERRNSPTQLNYLPEANQNIPFFSADVKGLQIKQPFQSGASQNTMVFNLSTSGYRNIKFAFAVMDEGAATGIVVDYATNAGTPVWTTTGMTASTFSLTNSYQNIQTDFSAITAINNNPNFKVRIRFTGSNMTADTGAQVTFNNISVHGVLIPLSNDEVSELNFKVYPNPATNYINVSHGYTDVDYKIYSLDGKCVETGKLDNPEIEIAGLSNGIYLLKLTSEGKSGIVKFIKE